jgi:hypothetical protein
VDRTSTLSPSPLEGEIRAEAAALDRNDIGTGSLVSTPFPAILCVADLPLKGRAIAYGVFFRTQRKFGIRMRYGAQFSNPASVLGARSASKISLCDSSALKGGEVFLSRDP